jgi:hypothetical protein
LLSQHAGHDEVTPFLMRLAWHGRMKGIVSAASRIALDINADRYARQTAIRVVMSLGSAVERQQVFKDFCNEAAELNRSLIGEFVKGSSATGQDIDWLLDAMAKSALPDRHQVDELTYSLTEFVGKCGLDLLPKLIARCEQLIKTPPVVERLHCKVSTRYGWLLTSAEVAIERLLSSQNQDTFAVPVLSLLQCIPAARAYNSYDSGEARLRLGNLVSEWPELNLALFWFHIEEARRHLNQKYGERLIEYWRAGFWYSFVATDKISFDDIIKAVRSRHLIDDRLVALSLAFQVYARAGKPKAMLALLKNAASEPELAAALGLFMNPSPPSEDDKKLRRMNQDHKRRMKQRQRKLDEDKAKWLAYLLTNVEQLRNPGFKDPAAVSQSQWYVHEHMRKEEQKASRLGDAHWRNLIPEFGPEVAQGFRDGVVAFWRRHKPVTRANGAEANTITAAQMFGLTGLSIDSAETTNWLETLTAQDAATAFAYAMHQLNGFPAWLPALVGRFTDQLVPLIMREIDHELTTETAEQDCHYILSDLSWAGDWCWEYIADNIFEILSRRQITHLASLQRLNAILQGSAFPNDRIARLAAEKLQTETRAAQRAHWYAVRVAVDPAQAIPALEGELPSISLAEHRILFAMQFITDLMGGRRSGPNRMRMAFRTPQHLQSLYVLMHQHIRASEDIRRAGTGFYSRGLRDDAQEARNRLFGMISEIPGKEAYIVLQQLAAMHPDEDARPWFHVHAKKKAETDGDLSPWRPSEVREFAESLERTPHDHRTLFELACNHLLDLKADLEQGDSSIASILRNTTQETDIRKYIAGWCRDRANNRYSIPQEEELADAKRPDMRWHGNGFDAPIACELKLADNWSGPQLFERLENQLCGDYLRDRRSGCGIFVLVYRGHKQQWDLPGGERVDFNGLLQSLQERWSAISLSYANIDDIRVIGIDLTVRDR